MQNNILKNVAILLRISGIYIIYALIVVFLITPLTDFYWLSPCANFIFFFFSIDGPSDYFFNPLKFVLFYVFLISVVGIAVIDFFCAFYIRRGSKIFQRIASYRSLLTCLFGFFLFILGLLIFLPLDLMGRSLIFEGIIYFLFYGTIFYLLKSQERRTTG